MMPNENLELAAYREKIALAQLEEGKAHERVLELMYEKARYEMIAAIHLAKEQEKNDKVLS